MSARRVVLSVGVVALAGIAAYLVVRAAKPQAATTAPSASRSFPAGKPSTTTTTRASAAADHGRPVPRPDLSPTQVVRIVMDALKNNDADDSGIAVTFDFASPSNKQATGPLARFIPMVKNPVYGPMLNHRSSKVGTVVVRDDQAQAVVTLIDAEGDEAAYLFRLSRQPADSELPNCWMTDGVIRVEPDDLPEAPKLRDIFGEDEPESA